MLSYTRLIETKSNVLRQIWVNILATKATLAYNSAVIVNTQPHNCVWSCKGVTKGKVKSPCCILLLINPTPHSCPSPRLSPFSPQQTCKHYWLTARRLSPWLSLSHSLYHHQKATGETHSKISIPALLMHSLQSRTLSVSWLKPWWKLFKPLKRQPIQKYLNLIYFIFWKMKKHHVAFSWSISEERFHCSNSAPQ